jgi:Small metal-binding protein
MVHNKPVMTFVGGLILVLVSASCSSKADTRTTAAYDSPAGAMAACPARTDAKGNVIYDDPTCPSRYQQPGQQMGNSYLTKESAFFDRYIDKAVKHAREAEIAGNQGHAAELLEHAQLSLDQAKQAQRAGNVPGLNEGIIALREALSLPLLTNRTGSGDNRLASDRTVPCVDQRGDATASVDCEPRNRRMGDDRTGNAGTAYDSPAGAMAACPSRTDAQGNVIYDDPTCPTRYRQPQGASLQNATAHVRDARIKLSQAGGIRMTAADKSSMAGAGARTVKGELIADGAFSRVDGGHHYLLRDRNGIDIPISLTQDMGRNVRTGDRVEAQVDSEGRVLAISKDQ